MIRDFEVSGQKALGFDTGLNARAFAQLHFAQYLAEPGLIVRSLEAPCRGAVPPNQVQLWRASGVREASGADGNPTMVIWGPPVEGEPLAALLDQGQDKALAAVSLWIQAILALGEASPGGAVPLWPSAALAAQAVEGRPDDTPSVFFPPPALVKYSVTLDDERYINPALNGMEAAAFTAAALLYRILAGAPPFAADNTSALHEDMRDGNFLPIRLAVPGLDSRLADLIQAALERPALEQGKDFTRRRKGEIREPFSSSACLASFASLREVLGTDALVQPLAESDRLLLEKEKARFLNIKTASVKAKRFIARNTAPLLGALAGVVVAAFIAYSVIGARAYLPTTAGMESAQVIESYYRGFGEMDHQMMEACVSGGAGKNDINAVVNFSVLSRTRQAYDPKAPPFIVPAHQWQGGELQGMRSIPGGQSPPAPLFGAADLRIQRLEGDESGGEIRYRVDYTFWIPEQASGEKALSDSPPLFGSLPYQRRDFLTLVRKKGNWRIAEIARE